MLPLVLMLTPPPLPLRLAPLPVLEGFKALLKPLLAPLRPLLLRALDLADPEADLRAADGELGGQLSSQRRQRKVSVRRTYERWALEEWCCRDDVEDEDVRVEEGVVVVVDGGEYVSCCCSVVMVTGCSVQVFSVGDQVVVGSGSSVVAGCVS